MESLSKYLLRLAASIALLAVAWLAFIVSREIPLIRPSVIAEVDSQATGIRSDLVFIVKSEMKDTRELAAQEIGSTRTVLSAELEKTRQALSRELESTRAELRGIGANLTQTADNRLSSIQADLNGHLSKTESDLNARLENTNSILADSVKPMKEIAVDISQSSDLFFDCDHNADCVFNRWVGMGRSAESTSESIAKISNDLSVLTHKLTEPKPWYRKVLDYTVSALLITAKVMN